MSASASCGHAIGRPLTIVSWFGMSVPGAPSQTPARAKPQGEANKGKGAKSGS
jgi:hypothetical protein